MRPCKCGKSVRLRAFKLRGPAGVAHYIEHMDGTPLEAKGWSCSAFKPYHKIEANRPSAKLIAKWEAA